MLIYVRHTDLHYYKVVLRQTSTNCPPPVRNDLLTAKQHISRLIEWFHPADALVITFIWRPIYITVREKKCSACFFLLSHYVVNLHLFN